MWPSCPVCYAAVIGTPIVKDIDTLAVHLAKAHGLQRAADGTLTVIPGSKPTLELRAGQASTVAILLGGSATVAVTWPSPMPSADYKVALALSPALLGAVKAPEITKQTAAGVEVKLTSAGLAVAASTLMAVAGAIVNPT